MVQLQYVKKTKKGYVALVTVIILAAVTSVVALTALSLGTDSTIFSAEKQNQSLAKSYANSCMEIAINKLKASTSYIGNESMAVGNGTCQILTISGSGNSNRTIQTKGFSGTVVRKLQVTITTVNPSTIYSSWQEADF